MDIPSPAYVAIGAIFAAIIAGGISFIIAVISKDQKTSEFRQEWINELRNDIADLISIFHVISDNVRVMLSEGKTKDEISKYLSQNDEYFRKLEMVDARIKLRINPNEHTKFLSALSALREFMSEHLIDSKAANALVDGLVKESQLILKREWKRVKRGEPVFVATKVISLFLLITAIALGIAYVHGHLHIELLL